MSTLTTAIQHSVERSVQYNKTRKGNIAHTDGEGRNKIAHVWSHHDNQHRKSQGIYTKLQECVSSARSQNIKSTCKSQVYFYILAMSIWKLQLKMQNIYTWWEKNRIHVRDSYAKNYTTLVKEIKEDQNKQWDTLCFWIRRLNIIKKSIL